MKAEINKHRPPITRDVFKQKPLENIFEAKQDKTEKYSKKPKINLEFFADNCLKNSNFSQNKSEKIITDQKPKTSPKKHSKQPNVAFSYKNFLEICEKSIQLDYFDRIQKTIECSTFADFLELSQLKSGNNQMTKLLHIESLLTFSYQVI